MFDDWIYRALTFLVISCPCALVISIPLSFFAGIGGSSREGILIKGSNYMETLSKTKYVVFDKTGTLTQGVFEVNGVHHSKLEPQKVIELAAAAECSSSHPISKSLQKAYGKLIDRKRVGSITELSGKGIIAEVDGHNVAVGNAKLMDHVGVVAIPCHQVGTIVHVAIDNEYAGHIIISDIIKPHAKEAVSELKRAGVEKTVMLTGDAKAVANQVASTLGIDPERAFRALANCRWPGRCDQVSERLIVDGGHNPDGIASLCEALKETFPGEKFTVVFAGFKDKDVAGGLRLLAELAAWFIFVPLAESDRPSYSGEELIALAKDSGIVADFSAAPDSASALKLAYAGAPRRILAAGSLYLAGEVLAASVDPAAVLNLE